MAVSRCHAGGGSALGRARPYLAGEKPSKQPEQLDGSNRNHDLGDFNPLGIVRIYEFIMILGILPHLELSGFMILGYLWISGVGINGYTCKV